MHRTLSEKGGMTVKRRVLAALCALLLCLGVAVGPLSAAAATTPCFMAVNDNLLELQDQYIPIVANGQYYVPYTALDSSVTGLELGIFPIYNSLLNTMVIYSRDQVLSFDLATGICTNRSGTMLSARSVTRNGRIYVPARFICEYFGLSYTNRNTAYGPLVRIRSNDSILDDNTFVGLAQLLMEDRLQDWYKSQAGQETPPVQPTTPSGPSTPVIPDKPSPSEPEVDKSGVRAYLAFRTDQTAGINGILDQLDYYQTKALFFFPASELAKYDDMVRSALCSGHGIGLLVSGKTAEEITAQAAEGNRLLAQIAHLNTAVLLASDVEDPVELQTAKQAGYLFWQTDIDAVAVQQSSISKTADIVLNNANRYRSQVRILLDTSASGASLLGSVLPEMVQDRYDLRLAVETEL